MEEFTWAEILNQLVARRDLSAAQAQWALSEVMTGGVSPARLAGFLMGLRAKGETVEELAGLAAAMIAGAVPIAVPGPTLDLVGTGGDRASTVNISTMASIVVAAAGHRVVKHGNRAATSASGSADVLEALGVRLDHSPQKVAEIALEAGITFCFAPVFHPAMRHAGVARKELTIPTAFNFLGPLTNPAHPAATAVGCADARMAPLMAGVLAGRGVSALVFRGDDGLDELAATAPATVWEARDGRVEESRLDAVRDLGLAPTTIAALRGADAAYNAGVARAVFDGSERGPIRETVVLNAAAALVAADAAGGAESAASPADGSPARPLAERLRDALAVAEAAL
ncbi:MAG: anthranilate phosphoribosyltransferase, partial [Promicromonosporaceae bacterium]|nr:anthranilate phosphoribosyltransferase [Promicromonosporaceae bacterium]